MGKTLRADVKKLVEQGHKDRVIAETLGITRHKARKTMRELRIEDTGGGNLNFTESEGSAAGSGVVTADSKMHSLEMLKLQLEVDESVWVVDRWLAGKYGNPDRSLWQVKAWFKPKSTQESNIERLIKRLEDRSPPVPMKFPGVSRHPSSAGRALEISIMDPHFGLRAFAGASGHDYDFSSAKEIWQESIVRLLQRSKFYGPFDEIVFVAGNDFLHADNVFHTTTAGTGQPEMDSWHHTFERGEELLIQTVDGLTEYAPVRVVMVPGNHARQSEYALGRILRAWYRNDENVTVDCGPEPYKFWRFGVNLIGYEHGHSIKANRLAGLMCNERRDDWPEVWQTEWHCGDQHRESAVFSEFGVNVKYLPSMVTWNEWHKIKSFSWAHRASLAFVYDMEDGLIATPQVNARELYHGGE